MKDRKLVLILVLSLFAVGTLILSNFLSFSEIQEVVTDLLVQKQSTETDLAAGRMESHVLQVRDELATLSRLPEIQELSAENCRSGSAFHREISTVIDTLLFADSDGDVVKCTSSRLSQFPGLNVRNTEYFRRSEQSMEPYVTGVVGSGAGAQIVAAAPVFSNRAGPHYAGGEDFEGILFTAISIDDLYNRYLHQYIRPGSSEFLLYNPETEAVLLKSQGTEYTAVKDTLPQTGPFSHGPEGVRPIGEWGKTIVTSSDMILGSTRLRLVVFTPLERAGPDMRSLQNRHLLGIIFILAVGLAAAASFVLIYKEKETYQRRLKQANVTLERLGISIGIERGAYADADVRLEPGKVYLVKDEENHAHELFISTLNEGYAGLGILRENPERFKERYNLRRTSLIWMSKKQAEFPAQTDVSVLAQIINQFFEKSRKGVVLIDRLDYLISENEFETVIKTVNLLADTILDKECIVILALNPELVTRQQLGSLEAATVDVYRKSERAELTDTELGILSFVNKQNGENRLVSYKSITNEFKITKPTTRTKIRKLSMLGLLTVEQRGRYKSLKITSAGRRLLR